MVITIWGNPCIMVAQDGRRHFREDYFYEILYERISAQTGGMVWTDPWIAEGVLYVASDDGYLYALE